MPDVSGVGFASAGTMKGVSVLGAWPLLDVTVEVDVPVVIWVMVPVAVAVFVVVAVAVVVLVSVMVSVTVAVPETLVFVDVAVCVVVVVMVAVPVVVMVPVAVCELEEVSVKVRVLVALPPVPGTLVFPPVFAICPPVAEVVWVTVESAVLGLFLPEFPPQALTNTRAKAAYFQTGTCFMMFSGGATDTRGRSPLMLAVSAIFFRRR